MSGSSRNKQKKLAAKQRKKAREDARHRAFAKTEATLADFRKKAASIKASLKQRGYEQKFYDYLDDYREAFDRIAATAKQEHLSLLGVHELDDDDYYSPDSKALFAKFGYGDLSQIIVTATGVGEDYLQPRKTNTVTGNTVPFKTDDGNIRTVIFIRRSIGKAEHPQFKYAIKIAALLHEIGHVDDWERGVNMMVGKVSMIDAEVYAHEHAFRKLTEGDYRLSLKNYLSVIEDHRNAGGYQAEIAERLVGTELFRRCQEFVKTNWLDHLRATDSGTQQPFADMEELPSMSEEED